MPWTWASHLSSFSWSAFSFLMRLAEHELHIFELGEARLVCLLDPVDHCAIRGHVEYLGLANSLRNVRAPPTLPKTQVIQRHNQAPYYATPQSDQI
jgi:hypothetical protein